MTEEVKFSDLVGKTLISVNNVDGLEIIFTANDGSVYKMYHEQDCCENVSIDDVCGNLDDLVGSPILQAEESVSTENPKDVKIPEYQDSFTWTFYRLATIKGSVVIRWYGGSNGYYSESVDFVKMQ